MSGRVQGVGFRFFAERTAAKLGVRGFARNLFDGRVEVYAMGIGAQLAALKVALQHGPRGAAVERVDEEYAERLERYDGGFFIESDG